MDEGSVADALAAVERAAEDPGSFYRPFVDLFPISGASVSTVGDFLGSETVSASDDVAARVDELQFDLGEGPCWDAVDTGRPVMEPDLQLNPSRIWPLFSAAIREQAVGSLFAFPLAVGPLRFGAVDLYSDDPTTLTGAQTQHAEMLAAAVSRHVLRRALDESGGDYADTGNAYSRRLIHQATGMVLAQVRIPADEAMLLIQGHAFASERPMMQIAEDIIEGRLSFARRGEDIEAAE